jgi:PhnB protein
MAYASAEKAIRDKVSAWAKTVGSKDATAAGRFFDDDVVTFDLAPPLQHKGFDRAALEAWFKTWKGPIGYEPTEVSVAVDGDLAVARSLDHMTGEKTDGEKVDLWTRSTVCFRKSGSDWKVFHVHSSVPFYMDGSFRAAVDLKPGPSSRQR